MALDCGISSSLFWNSSVLEITDLMESFERTERRKQKQKAIDNYYLADQIVAGFNLIMNGNENGENNPHMLWDYYPGLFEEEKKLSKQLQEQDELERAKAGRRRLANAMNKKLANVSNDEILANNDKQDAFRQVGNKNTNTQGMWGTAAIVAPLATTYIGSGYDFGAMTGTGVIAAASCGAITSMGTTAVNNYIISKIKAQESLNMCCNLLKKFKSRDNS